MKLFCSVNLLLNLNGFGLSLDI
ncbi:hypothetical protein BCEN4_740037 [Burkholderia cenocepacia]|nr:hypothetical protein BCEN4_740037 [Burkholderia cenocepacia]